MSLSLLINHFHHIMKVISVGLPVYLVHRVTCIQDGGPWLISAQYPQYHHICPIH